MMWTAWIYEKDKGLIQLMMKNRAKFLINHIKHRIMYIALIQKRTEYGNRHYAYSVEGETEESFVERMRKCYIDPYKNTDTPYYWEVEVYELGKRIDINKY